jgi:hypothetical protein
VEFLDSVLESTRAQEASIRKDTAEKLAAFRKHQEELEKAAILASSGGAAEEGAETWVATSGRKRKKAREKEFLKGVKLRKSGSVGEKVAVSEAGNKASVETKREDIAEKKSAKALSLDAAELKETTTTQPAKSVPISKPNPTPALGLGLGNYSSEEDD